MTTVTYDGISPELRSWVDTINALTPHTHVYKGIHYFATYELARAYAQDHNMATDRLIFFERGWAIQLRVSGPYA